MFNLLLLIFCTIMGICLAADQDDLVSIPFPGLGITPPFKMYSGYMDAKNQNGKSNWKMFYWLTEAKVDPESAPLAIYYSGGPGCSSVGEAFEEMGPFYVNFDGKTLYENIYAWNAMANVLYIDSPIGVGFSYDTKDPAFKFATDEQTAEQNYNSLIDLFTRVQPKYSNRSFFLTGSSYSGIYQPMLAAKIVDGINSGVFPNKNFKGFAIGNGALDMRDLNNALVMWSAYHGKISITNWEQMKEDCYLAGVGRQFDMDTYDFHRFLTTDNGMDYRGNGSACGKSLDELFYFPDNEDHNRYVYYDECWGSSVGASGDEEDKLLSFTEKRRSRNPIRRRVYRNPNKNSNINTADLLNYDSTDSQFGFSCWIPGALSAYMNRADVWKVLNIADDWRIRNATWEECSDAIGSQYNATNPTMKPFFNTILNNSKTPLSILIYNGDVDTVCNYLGDSRFVKRIALNNGFKENKRGRWLFRGLTAGFQQRYTKGQTTIDVLTVKGAGHFVPNDRPGPSMQMISNFLTSSTDSPPSYDSPHPDPTVQPLPFHAPSSNFVPRTFQIDVLLMLKITLVMFVQL